MAPELIPLLPWLIIIGMSAFTILVMAMVQWRLITALERAPVRLVPRPPPPQQPPQPQPSPPPPPRVEVPPPAPKPPPAPVPAPAPPPPPAPARTAYDKAWAAMVVSPAHKAIVDRDAAKVLTNKTRYEGVSLLTGVPWYVIGIIDMMEAGGGCDAHLHNGDPLKGRTIHVPAGRPPPPADPPFTWEQSALDALVFEGFEKVKDWSISGICGAFERYNGMGYHNRGVPSPYLWSFSNQYTSGKFVADHVYDENAVSAQAGAMPILKSMMALDPSINL